MKDKIIKIGSGEEYYILEELNYEDQKYVLGVPCNLEKDEIDEEKLVLFNINIKDNDLVINNVHDQKLAETVTQNIIEKIRNS